MNHYIITYHVIVDDNIPIEGTTGNVVFGPRHSRDYKPLQVAEYIRDEYRLLYPRAAGIRVRFQDVVLADAEEYEAARHTFTLAQRQCRVNS